VRSILEELPHALLPDPERESDDTGVRHDRLDDDLVRPVAEEELARGAARGERSPLARDVLHTTSPLDPAQPLTIGVRLAVEGVRVTNARFELGHVHQGLEQRARGHAVDDVAVWRLVARAEPGPLSQLALSLALERLAGITAPERARALRAVVVDLVAVHEALGVLASPSLRAPRLRRAVALWRRDVDALLQGIVEGDTLAAIGGLRRDLHADERSALLRLLPAVLDAVDAIDLDEVSALRGVGVLPRAYARALGVDGPAARAIGLLDDTPCDHAFVGGALGDGQATGCTLARLRMRVADAHAALRRVDATLRELPDGAIVVDDVTVPDGVAHAVVRGPSGSASLLVAVRARRLERVRLRPPDLMTLAAVPRALVGVPVDDAAAVIASFGMHATALDR
jgi:Ni,Fe-hydrogenase III large subunit